MRDAAKSFELDVIDRLARVETKLDDMLTVKDDVDDLKESRAKERGIMAGLNLLAAGLGYLGGYFFPKH
jgi:hypothetical protein